MPEDTGLDLEVQRNKTHQFLIKSSIIWSPVKSILIVESMKNLFDIHAHVQDYFVQITRVLWLVI